MKEKPKYSKSFRLFRHGNNLMTVNATVGGNQEENQSNRNVKEYRLRLLVDTGASFTILPKLILKDLGYDLDCPLRHQDIITVRGQLSVPVMKISWFNCAGQFIKDFEILALDIPPNLRVRGVLGMDFLCDRQAILSLAHSELYFLHSN